jgi:hypothetical protein
MAKAYNYMKDQYKSVNAYGVNINPYCGEVSTLWRIPAKYSILVDEYLNKHFVDSNNNTPDTYAIVIEGIAYVKFEGRIDYDGIFDNTSGSELDKLIQVMTARNEAINVAAFNVVKSKELFANTVRAMYYLKKTFI